MLLDTSRSFFVEQGWAGTQRSGEADGSLPCVTWYSLPLTPLSLNHVSQYWQESPEPSLARHLPSCLAQDFTEEETFLAEASVKSLLQRSKQQCLYGEQRVVGELGEWGWWEQC